MEMGYFEREFDKFYREYLGLDGGMEVDSCLLCRSEHRNEPLNKTGDCGGIGSEDNPSVQTGWHNSDVCCKGE